MFKKIGRILFRIFLAIFISSIIAVVAFRIVPVPFTPLMLIRCGQQLSSGKGLHLYKDWKPLSEISPHLQLAVVASEDQIFLEHSGFDLKAIKEAAEYNRNHKKKRGGSTISQQTAKNVFLIPSRSFIRKGFELYFTFLIELVWGKERIMEVYLNVIEMGDGVYGAEAAAQTYYHLHARDLSVPQAAAIASILPSPLKYKATAPSPFLQEIQANIIRQMNNLGGTLDYSK